VGESGVGSEVDEARLERRTRCLSQFEGANGFELLSRALAAFADAVSQSGDFGVEFGIGHAAHSWDLPMLALCAAASIHASRWRYNQSGDPGVGCGGFWPFFVFVLRHVSYSR